MSKRRAKGEGSVFTRKDGRVVGEWDDANGKTRYMTSTKMSKAEMSKAVRKKLQDRDEGIAAHSEGLTTEKYMDRWLEAICGNVRPIAPFIRCHARFVLHASSLYVPKTAEGLYRHSYLRYE